MHLLKLDTFDTIVLRQALKDTMAQHGVLSVVVLLLVVRSMRTQQRSALITHLHQAPMDFQLAQSQSLLAQQLQFLADNAG
jgi:hypothetical protein